MQNLDVIYFPSKRFGWSPIHHFARMTARLFDANYIEQRSPPRKTRLKSAELMLLGKGRKKGRSAILIAKSASDIVSFVAQDWFRNRYEFVAVWICDSFHVDQMPHKRILSKLDLIIPMRDHHLDDYRAAAGDRVRHLTFGADVLDTGGIGADRDIDLLRVGRQPEEWDDDDQSFAACEAAGIRFHGGPPGGKDPLENLLILADRYRRSKFTIAHTNLLVKHASTHDEVDYLTARWTDSVANGTVVVGIHPETDTLFRDRYWPEAFITLDGMERASNIEEISRHLANWSPAIAKLNHRNALERLDWRWRLKELAGWMNLTTPVLDEELDQIRSRIANLQDQI